MASARELDGVMGYRTNDRGSAINRPQCGRRVALRNDFPFVAIGNDLQPSDILREAFLLYVFDSRRQYKEG